MSGERGGVAGMTARKSWFGRCGHLPVRPGDSPTRLAPAFLPHRSSGRREVPNVADTGPRRPGARQPSTDSQCHPPAGGPRWSRGSGNVGWRSTPVGGLGGPLRKPLAEGESCRVEMENGSVTLRGRGNRHRRRMTDRTSNAFLPAGEAAVLVGGADPRTLAHARPVPQGLPDRLHERRPLEAARARPLTRRRG